MAPKQVVPLWGNRGEEFKESQKGGIAPCFFSLVFLILDLKKYFVLLINFNLRARGQLPNIHQIVRLIVFSKVTSITFFVLTHCRFCAILHCIFCAKSIKGFVEKRRHKNAYFENKYTCEKLMVVYEFF